jgi:periplasmic protein TonB
MRLQPAPKVVAALRRARHTRHASWSSAIARLEARVLELERRFGALDRRYAALAIKTRLQLALLASIAVHVVVIAGVTFTTPDKKRPSNLQQPLDVVLVNAISPTKPHQADALAQANLDGGGNTDAKRRAKSPFPVARDDSRTSEPEIAARRVERLEQEARRLMAVAKPEAQVDTAQQVVETPAEAVPTPNGMDLRQRSLEIARLEAQISREWESYQKRPRRRFIGARTQEFRFARYIEDWRLKIERIGDMNYPQAARDQKVYGSLVVTVSIKADGALEKVEINRPSGQKLLDEAALRIVRLAAPYAPFPADISQDTDILSITRTWTFTRSDQLVTD